MFKRFFRRNFKVYGAYFDNSSKLTGSLWAVSILGDAKWYLGRFTQEGISIAQNLYSMEWDVYRNAEVLEEEVEKFIEKSGFSARRPYPDLDGIKEFRLHRAEGLKYREIQEIMKKDLKTLARWNKYQDKIEYNPPTVSFKKVVHRNIFEKIFSSTL